MSTLGGLRITFYIALMAIGLAPKEFARATTVEPMDLVTAADHAAQVISGRIAQMRSYWAEDPQRIETEITFDGVTYLKSAEGVAVTENGPFTLLVPGGTVGTVTMRIAGAPEFHEGETWLLFLLPTYRTFPVVGVTQGAFRVVTGDDGSLRVLDADASPITDLRPDGTLSVERGASPLDRSRLIEQVNARVESAVRTSAVDQAMRYEEFLARLRPILQASRGHSLNHPAGRPATGRLMAKPLHRAQPLSAENAPSHRGSIELIESPRRRDDGDDVAPGTRPLPQGGRR